MITNDILILLISTIIIEVIIRKIIITINIIFLISIIMGINDINRLFVIIDNRTIIVIMIINKIVFIYQ